MVGVISSLRINTLILNTLSLAFPLVGSMVSLCSRRQSTSCLCPKQAWRLALLSILSTCQHLNHSRQCHSIGTSFRMGWPAMLQRRTRSTCNHISRLIPHRRAKRTLRSDLSPALVIAMAGIPSKLTKHMTAMAASTRTRLSTTEHLPSHHGPRTLSSNLGLRYWVVSTLCRMPFIHRAQTRIQTLTTDIHKLHTPLQRHPPSHRYTSARLA